MAEKLITREEFLEFLEENRILELEKEEAAYQESLLFAQKHKQDLMQVEQQHIKNISKINKKYRTEEEKAWDKFEMTRAELSKTFVDGFLGGIKSMKSSSKDVMASLILAFADLYVGKLKALAAFYLASGNFIGMALALGQAGLVKALGGTIAGQIAGYEEGADIVPKTESALVHRGERIIPENLNVTGISNEDFVNAAMAGLNLPVVAGAMSNDNRTSYEDNRTFAYNDETMEGATLEDFLELSELTNSRFSRR